MLHYGTGFGGIFSGAFRHILATQPKISEIPAPPPTLVEIPQSGQGKKKRVYKAAKRKGKKHKGSASKKAKVSLPKYNF